MSKAKNPDPLYAAIGAYLKGERLSRNMKQPSVAHRIGITAQSLGYYERGMSCINTALFVRWCEIFNLNPGETLNLACKTIARRGTGEGEKDNGQRA